MSGIRIQLFGQLSVQRNEQNLSGFEAHKVQELFSYLLLHQNQAISRESLASTMWPDCTTAQSKKKLRQTLWRLQSALASPSEAADDRVIVVDTEWVRINKQADLKLDVDMFQKTFEFVQGLTGQELDIQKVQALQRAVELYQGPLLEVCYDEWCLYERERFQNMYLVMLEKLMGYYEAHQDYDTGILYGMRILSLDKARERAHRRLMRMYYLNGDRAAALRQYEQCATILEEELGVKPSKRTIALYKQILSEQLVEPEPAATPTEPQLAPTSKSPPIEAKLSTISTFEPRSTFEPSNTPILESLAYLIQLQEFLNNLQNQVQQSIQKVEQAMNNTDRPTPQR